jgi:hypothetical protein
MYCLQHLNGRACTIQALLLDFAAMLLLLLIRVAKTHDKRFLIWLLKKSCLWFLFLWISLQQWQRWWSIYKQYFMHLKLICYECLTNYCIYFLLYFSSCYFKLFLVESRFLNGCSGNEHNPSVVLLLVFLS